MSTKEKVKGKQNTREDERKERPTQKKRKDGKKSEASKINRLVRRKLEKYMNQEKREEHFDPMGYFRTNPKMYKYDLMYKVIEATALEKAAHERLKKEGGTREKSKKSPSPFLVKNSRQITLESEAFRIKEHVSTVLDETPLQKLAMLHGVKSGSLFWKKGSGQTQCSTNCFPPIQGYSRHVGSVLHGMKYMDYYMEQGEPRTSISRLFPSAYLSWKGGKEFSRRREQKKGKSSTLASDDRLSTTEQKSESLKSERSKNSLRSSSEVEKEGKESDGGKCKVDEDQYDDGTEKLEKDDPANTKGLDHEGASYEDLEELSESVSRISTSSSHSTTSTRPAFSHLAGASFARDRVLSAGSSMCTLETANSSEVNTEGVRDTDEGYRNAETVPRISVKSDQEYSNDEMCESLVSKDERRDEDCDNYSDDFEEEDSVPNTARSGTSSTRSHKSDSASRQTYVSHAEMLSPAEKYMLG